ncbi:MAG: riboflavin synthase [Microcella sp.]
MFTGIIEELGEIVALTRGDDGSARITVRGPLAVSDAKTGDSISVSGVCLTAVELDAEHFSADVMGQTLDMSNPEQWQVGRAVNLERAAAVGDRLGGHIVQGHIDGTARVIDIRDEGSWRVLRFSLDAAHAPLVVDKGSIAIDGISLTVSAAGDDWFEVSLIPETLERTTLGSRTLGDVVNIETDILARHVARLARFGLGESVGELADAYGRSDA